MPGDIVRIGCHVAFQRVSVVPLPSKARSRKARVSSAVAAFTFGFKAGPPVNERSVKMLCDPPSNTASSLRGVAMALKTVSRSAAGE